MNETVSAHLGFIPAALAGGPPYRVDLRESGYGNSRLDLHEVPVMDARDVPGLGLDTSGFDLLHSPSAVTDFYDCDKVMATYYEECKATARELTGAHTTFTFDHIIREPGLQYSGGGTDGLQHQSGVDRGGGHIGGVHMDYTDNTTWDRYLALHGECVPDASRTLVLNFWRPLSPTADEHPLAVCDARTVRAEDLQEAIIYGYGAANYSWHDIGIETLQRRRRKPPPLVLLPQDDPRASPDHQILRLERGDRQNLPPRLFLQPNPKRRPPPQHRTPSPLLLLGVRVCQRKREAGFQARVA